MKFKVYCDESRPDLLCSQKPSAQYMVIGGLWLPADERQRMKSDIHALRDKHRIGGEFKWQKVSPSKLGLYRDLADWFVAMGDNLRFRCIAVEHDKVDLLSFHNSSFGVHLVPMFYEFRRVRPCRTVT
ncbi:MAG: hypothetical protein KZQ99_19805 [Candidatus Thiodiazotropha sp. (ex Dulcina madagascariensis)]|nr:hypothetical protein [Candidatus Thiodiazotropha sp. (ex Dulcina madagascariensis)]